MQFLKGTFWVGRIKLAVESYDTEDPKLEINPMDKKQAYELGGDNAFDYFISAHIYYAVSIPEKDDYKVSIRWAEAEVSTKELESKNGQVEWNQCIRVKKQLPYDDSKFLPDLFVYL